MSVLREQVRHDVMTVHTDRSSRVRRKSSGSLYLSDIIKGLGMADNETDCLAGGDKGGVGGRS